MSEIEGKGFDGIIFDDVVDPSNLVNKNDLKESELEALIKDSETRRKRLLTQITEDTIFYDLLNRVDLPDNYTLHVDNHTVEIEKIKEKIKTRKREREEKYRLIKKTEKILKDTFYKNQTTIERFSN